jgi:glutaredoxin
MTLTIYSRPGCHLCDEMKAVAAEAIRGDAHIRIEDIDISSDPELESRYGLEVPVLMIDGTKIAKYRIEQAELRRAIVARTGGTGEAGGAGR